MKTKIETNLGVPTAFVSKELKDMLEDIGNSRSESNKNKGSASNKKFNKKGN